MIKSYPYKSLKWVDVDSPTAEEVTSLIKEYKLRPLIGEELLRPTRKPKIDVYDDYLYLVLHIPIRRHEGARRIIDEKEIDFIIGKNFVITTHVGVIDSLHSLGKSFETNEILDKDGIGNHSGVIFYYIMRRLYDEMKQDLEDIKDDLNHVEDGIFHGDERKMVQSLSELSREIIDFKQTARLHQEVLESFSLAPHDFFGDDFKIFWEDIRQGYASIHDLISINKELLVDLRETNASLLSTKQNENLKIFSILAFVTFPLTLLVEVFSLPTVHTPIIGLPYDWQILASTVVFLALCMFALFKKKGLL